MFQIGHRELMPDSRFVDWTEINRELEARWISFQDKKLVKSSGRSGVWMYHSVSEQSVHHIRNEGLLLLSVDAQPYSDRSSIQCEPNLQ